MLGELLDRAISYGTAGYVFVKPVFEKLFKNPEFTKAATEKLVEVAKGGRTRADELIFFASLVSLSGPDASKENKMLFLKKHYELCSPDLNGKTPTQITELLKKEYLAKGLVFLIAEDNKLDSNGSKFKLSNQVWYGIFLGINDCPNDPAKLVLLEERILHFGRNNQEKKNIEEIIKKISPYAKSTWLAIDSIASAIGDKIAKATKWIDRQYDEKLAQDCEIEMMIRRNGWNRLNPVVWFKWIKSI